MHAGALHDLGLDPATAEAEAGRVADQLHAVLTEPVVLGARTVQVRASVGVSVHPDDGAEFGQLLHRADARMYARKHPTAV
ncbi:diguanylate cyclase domain-containing protein [Modestobacter versicolor]|uniref:diguanylate cyclase domain-containing protein n=1 Tax=Modestobacter versicolor TaxID=429133 RepID=UPI0021ABB4C4|nr:diguanylate cyclase [Modestobacter versicolor]